MRFLRDLIVKFVVGVAALTAGVSAVVGALAGFGWLVVRATGVLGGPPTTWQFGIFEPESMAGYVEATVGFVFCVAAMLAGALLLVQFGAFVLDIVAPERKSA